LASRRASGYLADMRKLALAPLVLLAGCIVYRDAPIVDRGPPAIEGTPVALGQPVQAGPVVATPMQVVEDSRCPVGPGEINCFWAGRLIVSTRIDGSGWRQTSNLTLGEPAQVRGVTMALVSGLPEQRADRITPPAEYRFVYEAR
jgi:hypothetical protein